jgi:hypothetical protein
MGIPPLLGFAEDTERSEARQGSDPDALVRKSWLGYENSTVLTVQRTS